MVTEVTCYRCDKCDDVLATEEEAKACCTVPDLLDVPRIEQLQEIVKEHIEYLSETGRLPKDGEHWVFEAAVEAFYGGDIWVWYNGRYDE